MHKSKSFAVMLLSILVLVATHSAVFAAYSNSNWAWLTADEKYSKHFAPATVKVVKSVRTERGIIATEITADIKTSLSYAGAESTIREYELEHLINPSQLSYTVATVIIPQRRTLRYMSETFYDKNDKVLWSKGSGKEKEMNSLEFDEDFYNAIVDKVFQLGESKRAKADDRWIELWSHKNSDGISTVVTADTTTMRMSGESLVFWSWTEKRDKTGKNIETLFEKRAVNLKHGSESIVKGRRWKPGGGGWQSMGDELDGAYRMIGKEKPAYKGLERLRAYANGYSMWVNRYSTK